MAENPRELRTVLRGNAEFTKKLYTILAKNPGNVFFSPISIHAILSLAYQGSKGETQKAFSRTLNIRTVRAAAAGYKAVMTRLNSIPGVTLLIANKVYLHQSYQLQESFKRVAVEQFLSEVELVNFRHAQAAASTINAWVEKKTNDKIKDIISEQYITGDTDLVLVNAIYFKGKWAKRFHPMFTVTEPFYLNDNDTVDVKMMHITRNFYYTNNEELDAQVLELPFTNEDVSFIIALPRKRNGIAELEQKLAGIDITEITENMYEAVVAVSLPKFKIEQTIDLKAPLTELGLGVIFDPSSADLSGFINTTERVYVSKVIQKTFIDVNEAGVEAAAATTALAGGGPAIPDIFCADRPFKFFIRYHDGTVNSVLFEGKVTSPQCA